MKIENKLWFGIITGALVLLIGTIVFFAVKGPEDSAEDTTSVPAVLKGDEIRYEYTVYLGLCGGPIYDTSRDEMISDPSFKKAVSYQEGPLWPSQFIVGEHPARSKYPGIDEYIVGREVGSEFQFMIPVKEGIEYDDDLRYVIPIEDEWPLYETMGKDEFKKLFNKEAVPGPGTYLTHPFWKWEVEIFDVSSEQNVTLFHQPEKGMKLDALPWTVEVKDVSTASSSIVLKNDISNGSLLNTLVDPALYVQYDKVLNDMPGKGVITEFGPERIVLDFNDERAGKDICFKIEIIEIL